MINDKTDLNKYKKNKYSNITFAGSRLVYNAEYNFDTRQFQHVVYPFEVVPSIETIGKRKVKNFNISIVHDNFVFGVSTSEDFIIMPDQGSYIGALSPHVFNWVLVYVPAGTEPSPIGGSDDGTFSSYYSPAQNVIASGIWSLEKPFSMKSSLSRNLNSGDSIQLLLYYPVSPISMPSAPNDVVNFEAIACVSVNYAISF